MLDMLEEIHARHGENEGADGHQRCRLTNDMHHLVAVVEVADKESADREVLDVAGGGETSTLTRTSCGSRWRRLLDVDDAKHLCGVTELFNLDGAHINSSRSKVRPLCEPA